MKNIKINNSSIYFILIKFKSLLILITKNTYLYKNIKKIFLYLNDKYLY